MKKLVPALSMLLISAMLLGSSTYAWFSMNTQVTATGMSVKAQAEGGIVISNEAKAEWKATTTASHNTTVALAPTSTADVTSWYHNKSTDATIAMAGQDPASYATLDLAEKEGVGFVDSDSDATFDTDETAYYLLNKFYIQSSAEAMTLADGLFINSVTASNAANSTALDSSLRIAIKIGNETFIFAPIKDGENAQTLTYKVKNTTTVYAKAAGTKNVATATVDIPAYNAGGTGAIEASVYIYFEGEDAACKSNNITTSLDTLSVSVSFGTTTIS